MTVLETTYDNLKDVLQSIEQERQVALDKTRQAAKSLGELVLILSLFFLYKGVGWFVGIFLGVIALVIWLFISFRHTAKLAATFRNKVMPELVKALGEKLSYYPESFISQDDFMACCLFNSPDRYKGSDLVVGYVGDTHVRFSLVHAEEEYTVTETVYDTDSDGNSTSRTETHTEYRSIFSGLLFSADCNKSFSGQTLVYSGGNCFLSRMNRDFVHLENPEFNRTFTVYGSDQVEARYLLTPSFMERIMELRSRTANGLQLSFAGNRLFVAVPMSLSAFAPNLYKRVDNIEGLEEYYNTLTFITGMVNDLNLNTRIWSKHA